MLYYTSTIEILVDYNLYIETRTAVHSVYTQLLSCPCIRETIMLYRIPSSAAVYCVHTDLAPAAEDTQIYTIQLYVFIVPLSTAVRRYRYSSVHYPEYGRTVRVMTNARRMDHDAGSMLLQAGCLIPPTCDRWSLAGIRWFCAATDANPQNSPQNSA